MKYILLILLTIAPTIASATTTEQWLSVDNKYNISREDAPAVIATKSYPLNYLGKLAIEAHDLIEDGINEIKDI